MSLFLCQRTFLCIYIHFFQLYVTTKISLEIGKLLTPNTHKCNSSIVICMLISLENWEIAITKHPYYICTHLLTHSGAGAKSYDEVIYCKEKIHIPIHGKLLRTLIIGQSLTYMMFICSINTQCCYTIHSSVFSNSHVICNINYT